MSEDSIFLKIQAEITQILEAATNYSNDRKAFEEANATIHEYESQHWTVWVTALVLELADETKPPLTRETAGIYFHRCLTPKEDGFEEMYKFWYSVPLPAKNIIKEKLFNTMNNCPLPYSKIAAEGISMVAFLEVSEWKDFIPLVCSRITATDVSENLKHTFLIALFETCQNVVCNHPNEMALSPFSEHILSAIKFCLLSQNDEFTKMALSIFSYTIYFSNEQLNDPESRSTWIQAVLHCTKSANTNIRAAAFQCLVEFVPVFYKYLPSMIANIFEVTSLAIQNDEESVVKAAIEFWTTTAEYELENNVPQKQELSRGLLLHLEIFLSCLECPQTYDDWTVNSAASTCISALAQLFGNEIVEPVMNWINKKIDSPNPNSQAGAIFAFGSIAEGPDSNYFEKYVANAVPVMLRMLYDLHNKPVNNSDEMDNFILISRQIIWTFGKIAEFQPSAFVNPTLLKDFLECLCREATDFAPDLAYSACEALHYLFCNSSSAPDNPINPYMRDIMNSLMRTLSREDASEDNLRLGAMEAIISLVKIVPKDQSKLIEEVVLHLAPSLMKTIGMDNAQVHDLQAELCGVLNTCTICLGLQIKPVAKDLIDLFFAVLKSSSKSDVHQECFMAISSMIRALEGEFQPYLPELMKYLCIALSNWQDEELCRQAVYIVSDLALGLPIQFHDYIPEVLKILLNDLNRTESSVLAPKIVTALSDISNALPEGFGDFFPQIMEILRTAGEFSLRPIMPEYDIEQIERICEWREVVLSAYSSTILNMGENSGQAFQPYLHSIVYLLNGVIKQDIEFENNEVRKATCSLIRDLTSYFGNQLGTTLKNSTIIDFLEKCVNNTENVATSILAKEALSLTMVN